MPSHRRRNAIVLDSSSSESESEESETSRLNGTTDDDHEQRNPKTSASLEQKEAILLDSNNEDDDAIDSDIECRMNALNLGRVPGKGKSFKSQLDALHFDSSSEEEHQEDQGNPRKTRIPRKKSNRRVSAIELLDTDSSDGDGEKNESVQATASVLTSPRDSPEVFKIQTPSPSNSSLSSAPQDKEHEHEHEHEHESVSSSFSLDASEDLQSLDGKDTSESAWRRNKYGTFILKGKCLIAGDVQWPKIDIPAQLYDKLYDHQKIGVQWLASLHTKGIGGILGDDMGLGKTFQTCTLLGGLMRTKKIRNALIVCPVAVMRTWEKESKLIVEKLCRIGNLCIRIVDSSIKRNRRAAILEEALQCNSSNPHIVITTYGLVKSSRLDFLAGRKDDAYYWDYIVADEGHTLKNPSTDQHKAIARIARSPQTHRLLLTGTPIQNNMKELWALFDWATAGRLFGTQKRFLNQFAIPIEEGRMNNASFHTLRIASKANKELQEKLRPHFLQRMKNAEFKDFLPVKKELVVWLHLSDTQRKLYDDYVIDGGKVAAILSGEISSPLQAITWLKKLCDHPSLVRSCNGSIDPEILRRNSSKLDVLVYLVMRLKKSNHRCLIFSPSTKILDIMEKVLPVKLGRIDGQTKGKDRQTIVDRFNKDKGSYDALLLSTKAAGVGLTLTGADRAIIFSPSWNPADDSQAVDRCYRIGQRNNVTIYRFITAGTVEEHMYARQVQKDGIRRTLMTSSGCATERHFSKNDLKRLFVLSPRGECKMLEKINSRSSDNAQGSSGRRSVLDKHDGVLGISSHDTVYTNTVVDLSYPEQSPFAGTPMKSSKVKSASMLPPKHLTFENIARDAMPLRPSAKQNLLPRDHIINLTSVGVEEKCQNTAGGESSTGSFNERSGLSVLDNFQIIEALTNDGKIEKSLDVLLCMLESGSLQGRQKLLVHKKIASRKLFLGWN